MSRVHELVFKINGSINNSVNKAFTTMSSDVSKVSKRLRELEKQKINTEQFTQLNSKIEKTSATLLKSRSVAVLLRDEFEKSKSVTSSLKREWESAEDKVQRLSMAIAKTTSPTKEMRSELAVAKLEAKQLKSEFQASEKATNALGNKFKSADNEVNSLNQSLSSQEKQLREVNSALGEAGINSKNFEEKQKKLGKEIENNNKLLELQSKSKKSWKKTKDNGKDLLKKSALVGGAMAIPLKFAIDSESTMADIGKVVDFNDLAEKTKFEQDMRKKLGKDLPLEFEEYGELIANAAGAGIKKEELLDFSEDSAKMSVAFDIEGGEAGEKMAKWRAAFNMDQEEVVALADKINYLSDNSAATAPAISNIVSRVGALGGVAGMTSGDVAAIGTAMVSMGVGEEVGATAIKKIATQLTKGTAATKTQQKAFEKLGLSSEQLSKDMQTDSQATIMKVLGNINKLPKELQTSTLTQIFGEESVQAIAPLLANLDQLQTHFDNVDESVGKFKGSMQEEFEIRSDTAENQLIILKNNLNNIATTIGNVLLPYLKKGSDKVVEIAQRFQEWANKNPELVEKLVQLAAAFGIFLVAASGLKFILSLFSSLIISAKLFFLIIQMNPVVLVITAIIGALVLLWLKWDSVKNFITKGIDIIVQKYNSFKKSASDAFGIVANAGKKAANTIKEKFESAINWLPNKIKAIGDGFNNMKNKATNWITGGSRDTVQVGARAKGGIVKRPELSWIGEGGSHEAVIPLDGSNNAMKLWQYAGKRLGTLTDGNISPSLKTVGRGSSSISNDQIVVQFNIDVKGGGDNVKEDIEKAILTATPKLKAVLKQLLNEIDNDKKRVAFS